MKLLNKFRNMSFILQVIIVVGLLVSAALYFGGKEIKENERNYLLEELDRQTEKIFRVFIASNIDSIIAEDIPLMDTAVSSLMHVSPDITYIEIKNEEKQLLLSRGDPTLGENSHFVLKDVVYEGEIFGYVKIVSSTLEQHQLIEKRVGKVYLTSAIWLILMIVVLSIVVYLMLSRPIQQINKRLLTYLHGEKEQQGLTFYSREFTLLNRTIDQLKEVTTGRDQLRTEVEARKRIQSDLEHAKDLADKANQAKTDFLSFMTHEIRTPLTAIIGFSETLLDYKQTMDQRLESIHTIINSGNHLLQLINDVLDISKIEAGLFVTEKKPINFCTFLKDFVPIANSLTEKAGLTFHINATTLMPEIIMTDELRLRQILLNLVGNAVKFTEEGSVKLALSFDHEKGMLCIKVSDTGIGMTEGQRSKLFKIYEQTELSVARDYGGTGLGLFLSKNLVQMLGGSIDVESEEHHGTTFTLSLNIGDGSQLIPFDKEKLKQSSFTHVEKLDVAVSGRVLVADDVEENQKLIAYLLEKMKLEYDVAADGIEAVELALSKHYDLVLMDIQMPKLDGIGAVRQLREQGYQQPVIAMSANNMEEEVSEYLKAGCNKSIGKPIDRHVFKKLMVEYLHCDEDNLTKLEPVYSRLLEQEPGMTEVIDVFLARLPELIREMVHFFNERDWASLKDSLHNVKGVCGNYGYEEMMVLASKGEFVVASKDEEAFIELLEEIKKMEKQILMAKNIN